MDDLILYIIIIILLILIIYKCNKEPFRPRIVRSDVAFDGRRQDFEYANTKHSIGDMKPWQDIHPYVDRDDKDPWERKATLQYY